MPKWGEPTDFESFLTWEALTAVLSYDPATGEFRWIKCGQMGWKGRLAGTNDQGYCRIEILGRGFYAHRLAWLYMTKHWPRGLVDHKNGNRGDNRWTNLKPVSRLENRQNWAPYLVTSDGFKPALRQPKAKKQPNPNPKRGIASDFDSFLTQEIVTSLLSYDPATGEFVWRDNRTNPRRIKIGQKAGDVKVGEYSDISIMGRRFRAHRLAWLYMTGHWPKGDVDHKNGEKSDNRWENLRDSTRSQNAFNQRRAKDNASGIRGVHKHGKKWRAVIGLNNKQVSLGTFVTKKEAEEVRLKYEQEHFGDFANSVEKTGA